MMIRGLFLFIALLSRDLALFSRGGREGGSLFLCPTWQKRTNLSNRNVHWLCLTILNMLSAVNICNNQGKELLFLVGDIRVVYLGFLRRSGGGR